MKAKKAADQKALVIATTDVSLFTKGEEIDLKLLFGMFEPHEKPWFVHEDKQGNMRVVVPDKNSDIFLLFQIRYMTVRCWRYCCFLMLLLIRGKDESKILARSRLSVIETGCW